MENLLETLEKNSAEKRFQMRFSKIDLDQPPSLDPPWGSYRAHICYNQTPCQPIEPFFPIFRPFGTPTVTLRIPPNPSYFLRIEVRMDTGDLLTPAK